MAAPTTQRERSRPHLSAAPDGSPAPSSSPSAVPPPLAGELLVACALSWSAGVIHVEAGIHHLDQHALHSVLFGLLAAAQVAWGIALYRRPSRGLLAAGAAMSVLVVMVWAMSRTAGLPIGPDRWDPEPVGMMDSLASSDEAVLALLALIHLRLERPGPPVVALRRIAAAAGACLVLLGSLLLAGGHAH